MNARPILFSGEMVRALLDGRKTQTRRIVKPQPETWFNDDGEFGKHVGLLFQAGVADNPAWLPIEKLAERCPYGQPGDLLSVRETWGPGFTYGGEYPCVFYRADDGCRVKDGARTVAAGHVESRPPDSMRWKPSIHMPRWAFRLTLELTDVRVERLQDISEADAIAEGFAHKHADNGDVKRPASFQFRDLFYDINKRALCDYNPWVWALTFEVHRANVDELLKRAA